MSKLYSILVGPHETEKTNSMQKFGVHTFLVRLDADKKTIKQAIENYYGVKVKSVRTIKIRPKTRKSGRGRVIQKRALGKKAIIQTIDNKPIDVNKIVST